MEGKSGAKSRGTMAKEGLKILEETIGAAHQILYSLYQDVHDNTLWFTTEDSAISRKSLQMARVGFKSLILSLEATLTAILDAKKSEVDKEDGGVGRSESQLDEAGSKKLEERARVLQKEMSNMDCANARHMQQLQNKNKILKFLIDRIRELVCDISFWQSLVLIKPRI